MSDAVYITGIILQALGGLVALVQVRRAPHKLPWLLIAISALLIVFRRAATLGEFVRAERELAAAEVATLVISLLFFIGVLLISRMFREVLENQSALKNSEEQFRLITESIGDVVWLRSADNSRMLYISPAYEQVWERSCRSLYDDPAPFMHSVHPDDASALNAEYQKYMQEGTFNLEYRIVKPAGRLAWVHARSYPIKDDSGKVIRHAGLATDITERKQTEKALQVSEAFLSQSQQIAHVGSWKLDLTANHLAWSDETYRILGLKSQEFAPDYESFLGVVHPEDRAAVDEAYLGSLRDNRDSYEIEHRIIRHDSGEVRHVHERCIHERNADGEITGSIGMIQDISERKKSEAELVKLNVELDRRVRERTADLELINRELDAFTYSVSHDLRAPLRRIRGFSEAILNDYAEKLDQRGRDYLKRIYGATGAMNHLIEALLKLSRVTRQELACETVELSVLARAHLNQLHDREPGRSVESAITPDLVVTGDSALLRIALENLLDNAWKYTTGVENARIEFNAARQDGRTVFYISDNGAGFDMAYQDKLFKAFQRLHHESDYPGTGIGLSIVSRIITRHGGKIWAEGQPCQGATFYFTLP